MALAVLAVACTALSAFVYLRVVVLTYMREPEEPEPASFPLGARAANRVAALVTLVGAFLPGALSPWATSP